MDKILSINITRRNYLDIMDCLIFILENSVDVNRKPLLRVNDAKNALLEENLKNIQKKPTKNK